MSERHPMSFITKRSPAIEPPFVLGPGVSILGRFESRGQAIVEGHFEGELRAEKVVVSPGGRISGTVIAHEVVVEGHADSQIFADRIALRRGCLVTGELYHSELRLEPGAGFEGKSRRYPDPRRIATGRFELES